MNVRARLIIDQDKSSPFYFDEISNPKSIPQNEVDEFSFEFTPEEAGTYYFYIVVSGEYNSNYVVVDQHDWYKAFVALELPGGEWWTSVSGVEHFARIFGHEYGATESEYYITDNYILIICYNGVHEENTDIRNSKYETMPVQNAVTACFDSNNEIFIEDEDTITRLYVEYYLEKNKEGISRLAGNEIEVIESEIEKLNVYNNDFWVGLRIPAEYWTKAGHIFANVYISKNPEKGLEDFMYLCIEDVAVTAQAHAEYNELKGKRDKLDEAANLFYNSQKAYRVVKDVLKGKVRYATYLEILEYEDYLKIRTKTAITVEANDLLIGKLNDEFFPTESVHRTSSFSGFALTETVASEKIKNNLIDTKDDFCMSPNLDDYVDLVVNTHICFEHLAVAYKLQAKALEANKGGITGSIGTIEFSSDISRNLFPHQKIF